MPEPLLHVVLGMAIFCGALAILRSPRRALGIVFIVQLLNEVNDYFVKGHALAPSIYSSLIDTIVTMALPIMISVVAQYRFRRSPKPLANAERP